ncbi:MAG TPA: hypothetical protein VLA36_14290, partial [Longimicrobiales bacterium]|nr:hypothetical protein [Longimicrobiales bacterium]
MPDPPSPDGPGPLDPVELRSPPTLGTVSGRARIVSGTILVVSGPMPVVSGATPDVSGGAPVLSGGSESP